MIISEFLFLKNEKIKKMKNVKKRILPPIIPFTALNQTSKRNLRSYFAKTKEVFISNKRFSRDDIEEIFAQERSVYLTFYDRVFYINVAGQCGRTNRRFGTNLTTVVH